MPNSRFEQILKKINFIEADMEIQRQILASIPSDKPEDMEAVIRTLAEQKNQIQDLREQLKEADAAEYQRIIDFEAAAETFKALVEGRTVVSLSSRGETGHCCLELSDKTVLECLVKAREKNGNWIILTIHGDVKEIQAEDVLADPAD